jgi:hypothetical protein
MALLRRGGKGDIIPFWILDFRFWIGKCLLYLGFLGPSVAIIFQIGIK